VPNVPRLRRLPVRAFFLREYRRYRPDESFLIMVPRSIHCGLAFEQHRLAPYFRLHQSATVPLDFSAYERTLTVCRRSAALVSLWLLLLLPAAHAQEPDACADFKWDVSHERSLMRESPQEVIADPNPDANLPRLQLDTLYELHLAPQETVKFALPPGKQHATDQPQAGLVRFRVASNATYRISISTAHWIDVVDGRRAIEAQDFSGQHDCDRPRKIVQFELPAGRDLILQFSGAQASTVLVAISPVITEH